MPEVLECAVDFVHNWPMCLGCACQASLAVTLQTQGRTDNDSARFPYTAYVITRRREWRHTRLTPSHHDFRPSRSWRNWLGRAEKWHLRLKDYTNWCQWDGIEKMQHQISSNHGWQCFTSGPSGAKGRLQSTPFATADPRWFCFASLFLWTGRDLCMETAQTAVDIEKEAASSQGLEAKSTPFGLGQMLCHFAQVLKLSLTHWTRRLARSSQGTTVWLCSFRCLGVSDPVGLGHLWKNWWEANRPSSCQCQENPNWDCGLQQWGCCTIDCRIAFRTTGPNTRQCGNAVTRLGDCPSKAFGKAGCWGEPRVQFHLRYGTHMFSPGPWQPWHRRTRTEKGMVVLGVPVFKLLKWVFPKIGETKSSIKK